MQLEGEDIGLLGFDTLAVAFRKMYDLLVRTEEIQSSNQFLLCAIHEKL